MDDNARRATGPIGSDIDELTKTYVYLGPYCYLLPGRNWPITGVRKTHQL